MTLGDENAMRETAETRAATQDAAFDAIVERIKNSGAAVEEDETYPLYKDAGREQYEVGYERSIVFNMNKTDFKLTRTVETHRMQGAGQHKQIQKLQPARATLKLKKKSELEDAWQVVDFDDMF